MSPRRSARPPVPGMSGRSCTSPQRRHSNTASPPATLTYGEASAAVEAIADRYAAAGYGVGHRVGLMLENRPATFLHWFGLNRLGTSVVPLHPDLRPAELAYLMLHSGICLAIGATEHVLKLRGALGERAVITDDAPVPTAPSLARQATPGPATECALLYTSGTTGKPKGCVLSNDYFLRCGRWYTEIGGLCTLHPGEDRLITPLPMTHMNAMACSTLGMVMTRRLHHRARPVPSAKLVADGTRQQGDDHAQPRRDADHAARA